MKANSLCYGLSRNEVRRLAFEFAKKINASVPQPWIDNGTAGSDWFDSFKKHRLTLRMPQQISTNRMKSFNKNAVDEFFDKLKVAIPSHSYFPNRICNMDGTGFSTVPPKPKKIVALVGSKLVCKFASQERGTNVTMAIAINAVGQYIPPFYLFPRTPRKKSNRGRKPMQSAILTSAEKRKELDNSAKKGKTNATAKKRQRSSPSAKTSTPAKNRHRKQSPSSSSESDEDFCIICLEPMPKKCTKSNSIKCMECKREVHLKCANMTQIFWICEMCEPESD